MNLAYMSRGRLSRGWKDVDARGARWELRVGHEPIGPAGIGSGFALTQQ